MARCKSLFTVDSVHVTGLNSVPEGEKVSCAKGYVYGFANCLVEWFLLDEFHARTLKVALLHSRYCASNTNKHHKNKCILKITIAFKNLFA